MDEACARYVRHSLAPALRTSFAGKLGVGGWDLNVDPDDRYGHTLLFRYPSSAPEIAHSYIRERVKIELGWRAAAEPSEIRTFRPYAAEQFPDAVRDAAVTCVALTPARTCWEKVTALHAESFRTLLPRFFSRHYSDVATMFGTAVGASAARDLSILEDVRRYKDRYYRASWARYDLAVPGSLVLVPSDDHLRQLASDYAEMRVMFFEPPPPFRTVVAELARLESQINRR